MIREHIELNEALLRHVKSALHDKLFVGVRHCEKLTVTEVKLDWELGAIYFTWDEQQWRVSDRYYVERKSPSGGYVVDRECLLIQYLLRKNGELAQVKRDLRLVRSRFSDLNGEVSQKVWNENYPAVKALDEILKEE